MQRLKSLAAKIAALGKVLKKAFVVFWGIEEGDNKEEMATKVAETIARGAAYSTIDWLLTALTPVLIGGCKWLGMPDGPISIVVWIYDWVGAKALVSWNDNSAVEDLTLTNAIRRSYEEIKKENKIVAFLFLILLLIKFAVWDGPERAVLFFKKELPSRLDEILILTLFSLFQAVFWTKVYSLGIDGYLSLSGLWKLYF